MSYYRGGPSLSHKRKITLFTRRLPAAHEPLPLPLFVFITLKVEIDGLRFVQFRLNEFAGFLRFLMLVDR